MGTYSFTPDGSKKKWDGYKWNPFYWNDLPIHTKILNYRISSYHWDGRYCKPTDFVSDY